MDHRRPKCLTATWLRDDSSSFAEHGMASIDLDHPHYFGPYERSRRPSRRKPDGPIVGKVVAGVPTGRAPRTSPTVERSERDSARHHPNHVGSVRVG